MKRNKTNSGHYADSRDLYPEAGGPVGVRKPRRNYWGNLFEEDIFREESTEKHNYDFSDYDPEDDHSSYYDQDGYD